MRIIPRRLPPFCHADRDMTDVSGIVVHYVSARTVAPDRTFSPTAVRELLLDLNRPASERECFGFDPPERLYGSYHYMIGRRGGIYNLVPLPVVAYHAGVSEMHGRAACNEFCIGISLIATDDSGFTESQYRSLTKLVARLMREHAISVDRVQGHEDVARPPGRKQDPGPLFDWVRLRTSLEGMV